MALSTGNTILWSDINAVLSNVNRARSNCGFGAASISGGVGTAAKASNVSDLYNALKVCNGKVFPASGGTVFVASIAMPSVGSLITPVAINAINTEANRIAAMNSANFGFGFNSSFNSSFDGFSFGFNSSFNSSFDGFSFGFNSSFNAGFNSSFDGFGFNSGFNSSFDGFGFNSGFNGSYNSGFSCSCQGFNFTCSRSCTFSSGGGNGSFSFRFSFLNTKDDNYIRRAYEQRKTSKWSFTPER